jgi:hypothetical protein
VEYPCIDTDHPILRPTLNQQKKTLASYHVQIKTYLFQGELRDGVQMSRQHLKLPRDGEKTLNQNGGKKDTCPG